MYPMSSRLTLPGVFLIAMAFATVALQAQAVGDPLRQHYNRAEDLQRAGNPSAAAEEYHAFLAGALGELARHEQYLAWEDDGRRYDLGARYGLLIAQLALAFRGQDRSLVLSQLVELLADYELSRSPR